VAQQAGRFDKNIDLQNPAFQALIRNVAAKYAVGLHPSWASGDQQPLLPREKSWLEKQTDHTVTTSRQHYLRFTLPTTYRRLQAIGIQDEYSMGYGTINGFRASVATPFFWYDLKDESKTSLRMPSFLLYGCQCVLRRK
jgi:hypothetical protein